MKNKKIKLIIGSSILFFSAYVFTIIQGYVPFLGTWIGMAVCMLFATIVYPNILLKRPIVLLLVYTFIMFLKTFTGNTFFTFNFLVSEFLYFFVPCAVFIILTIYDKFTNIYIWVFVVVLLITFIGTYMIYKIDPDILRLIGDEDFYEDSTYNKMLFYRRGGMSYWLGHALPVFIPPLVFVLKSNSHSRLFRLASGILILIIFAMVYMSTATTALLLMIGLLVISFLWKGTSFFSNIGSFLFMITVGLIIGSGLLKELLSTWQSFTTSSTYSDKIVDINNFLSGANSGQIQGRSNLYLISWNTFFENILFGANDANLAGRHAFFVDRGAMMGIVGLIPLFGFIEYFMKYVLRLLSRRIRPYYIMGMSYFIVMGFLKNLGTPEFFLSIFFYFPVLCLFFDRNGITK